LMAPRGSGPASGSRQGTNPRTRLMQLKTAKILGRGRIRRTAKKGCEGPHVPDIVVARLLDEVAHVLTCLVILSEAVRSRRGVHSRSPPDKTFRIHGRSRSTFEHREHDVSAIKKNATEWTGGCQCGAVRYQLLTPPEHACICHCRMCQRASGQPFMAFASVRNQDLRWTRGRPSTFVSSNIVSGTFAAPVALP
jgi:hypothetical protein